MSAAGDIDDLLIAWLPGRAFVSPIGAELLANLARGEPQGDRRAGSIVDYCPTIVLEWDDFPGLAEGTRRAQQDEWYGIQRSLSQMYESAVPETIERHAMVESMVAAIAMQTPLVSHRDRVRDADGGRLTALTFGLHHVLAALAMAVGIADTWMDWRSRARPAT